MSEPTPRDIEQGCEAFGHLASPYADTELGGVERERFETHLGACGRCRQVIDECRALDVAWREPVPTVSETDWAVAWRAIATGVESDRARASRSPFHAVGRWLAQGLGTHRHVLQPLAYAAAAVLVVAILLGVRERPAALPTPPSGPLVVADGSPRERPATANPTDASSVACKNPDWVPVVWTMDGDEPVTVVQCVPLTAEI